MEEAMATLVTTIGTNARLRVQVGFLRVVFGQIMDTCIILGHFDIINYG